MSAIDDYNQFKRDRRLAADWGALIGAPYHDGGGGIGTVHSVEVKATVHHQKYDGATNYHECPARLKTELAIQVRAMLPQLFAAALAGMDADGACLVAHAISEHEKMLRDAGILIPNVALQAIES